MIFVDTGYFVALFEPRDNLHARARAWAGYLREPLVVSEYVLIETMNRFSQVVDRGKAHAIADLVRVGAGYRYIPASAGLFEESLRMHVLRQDKDWSFADCTSFIIMRDQKITRALAFDQHLQQAGFEAMLRRDTE